ncbi:MAG TPA: hypothetical protein PKV02_00280 [Bacteroidia bacterium]|nr:hypothetical protein [Bacteroidia bacterium]
MNDSCLKRIAENTNNFSSLLESIFQSSDLKSIDVTKNISNDLFSVIKNSLYLQADKGLVSQNQLPVIFANLLNDFSNRVSQEFQFSILSGEHYYQFANEGLKKINLSLVKLKESINKLSNLRVNNSSLTGQVSLLHFTKDVELFLNLYNKLVKFVEIELDFSSDTVAISKSFEEIVSKEDINKIIELAPRANLLRPFLEPYFLFQLNIKVAYIDDNISCDMEKMYELITIKNYLNVEHFRYSRTLDILTDKCKYLIKKIYFSLHEKKNKLINDLDPSGTKISDYKVDDFSFFENQTLIHYVNFRQHINQSLLYPIEEAIKSESDTKACSFREIYLLSKYYSQEATSIHDVVAKMDLLIKHFETKFASLQTVSNFDKQAYKTSLIFFKNRKLEILYTLTINKIKKLQIENLTSKNIEERLMECLTPFNAWFDSISPQQKAEIKNYFPFYLYCLCYNKILFTLKSISSTITISFNLVDKLIEQFRGHYAIAHKNLQWCKDKNYMLLYLPYNECSHDIVFDKKSGKTIKIFLDSSFVFPIDYDEKERQLSECMQNFIDHRTLLLNNILGYKVKKIEASVEEFQTTSSRLENKLDTQFSNHVQLLAVFAAIIAYVIGSISIIPKLPDIKSIIVFMLSFSFALSCFVLLIRALIKEDLKKIYSTFLSFLVLLFVCIFLLFYWNPTIMKDPIQPPIESDSSSYKDSSQNGHSTPVTIPPAIKDSKSIKMDSTTPGKNQIPSK